MFREKLTVEVVPEAVDVLVDFNRLMCDASVFKR
jgi:hypothetical protein